MGESEQGCKEKIVCPLCGNLHDGLRKEMHIDGDIFGIEGSFRVCEECFKKVAANKQKGWHRKS